MDEAVIKYYRRLLKEDFPNAGILEPPFVFVEAIGQKLIDCGNTGNYMQLYFTVADDRIAGIKYLCSCEPVANVAVEVLCSSVKGMKLDEASTLNEDHFCRIFGGYDEEFCKKIRGLLELLNEGIEQYRKKSIVQQ